MNFERIERSSRIEYVPQLAGNRSPAANWFQCASRKGCTVYRDKPMRASACAAAAVKRIGDVNRSARADSFAEDQGR